MIRNSVKQKLQAGEVVVGSFLVDFAVPGIGRVLAAAGDQFVMFDQEHTGWSTAMLRPLISECHRAEIVPMVRVPAIESWMISSVLDAGALGVMAPMVQTVEQARALVAAAKYSPQGSRGVGPLYPDEVEGAYVSALETINREQLVVAMIETEKAIENVAGIAAVEGLDLLWIGHGDLTSSLGIPGEFTHERYLEALSEVFAAAEAVSKPVAIMATSPVDAVQHVERGFRCIGVGDRPVLMRGLAEIHAAIGGE
jgi:2-dehydro-3-deoxyglucarate aldolase/4-hydroxy-2-oxoheptanedioate aldolase